MPIGRVDLMAEAYRLRGDFSLEDLLDMAFWKAQQGVMLEDLLGNR